MQPGLGFGGSCFPKDVLALVRIAESRGETPSLLHAVLTTNRRQLEHALSKIVDHFDGVLQGRHIGFLGLAFTPNTDDIRESPALALALAFRERGARVLAHDPQAMANVRAAVDDRLEYAEHPYDAAQNAQGLVIATDWNEYKQLDLSMLKACMEDAVIFDLRNMYDLGEAAAAGLRVIGIGRGAHAAPTAPACAADSGS